MNPDLARAVERLQADGVLPPEVAARFLRQARRDLVSVRVEFRALLYAGVLLLTSGIALFLKEHHERLGPWMIAALVAALAAGCLVWVARRAPAFSWLESPSPTVAFDYILLLGVLLVASDLAYLEVQVTLLGAGWPYHLLIVSLLYVAAAYRYDSRAVLGLALASFAAWRGISVSLTRATLGVGDPARLRLEALLCGVLFLLLAWASRALRRKAHFEDVYANFGLLLVFGGLLSGAFLDRPLWRLWALALFAMAGGVIVIAFRLGRTLAFAQGVLAAYVGLLRIVFGGMGEKSGALLFTAISSVGILALLAAAHRRIKERR
jgi:hypothetical protein